VPSVPFNHRVTAPICRSRSATEKSQIQALDRTQPGLPMKKGRAATLTHDYKRHGTTTLFAALDVLEGKVIGQCMKRHRHQEFIRFLNVIDTRVPAKKTVHAIIDNYAAHKHPKVLEWLARHPRFVFHFTPTSASWLNAVEGLFALLLLPAPRANHTGVPCCEPTQGRQKSIQKSTRPTAARASIDPISNRSSSIASFVTALLN
jgi:transposase